MASAKLSLWQQQSVIFHEQLGALRLNKSHFWEELSLICYIQQVSTSLFPPISCVQMYSGDTMPMTREKVRQGRAAQH